MVNQQSTLSPPEPTALDIGKGTAELGETVVFIGGQAETSRILEFAGTPAQEHGARPGERGRLPGPVQGHRPSSRNPVGVEIVALFE